MNAEFAAAPLSFIAKNRMAEERAAADPKYRRDLEQRGKPLLSHARTLTDEVLLEKLDRLGIEIDKNSYAEIAEHALAAEEIARTAVTSEARARFRGRFEEDWVWLALTVLWERWFPQWPNFEQLDDQMQAGYALSDNDSPGVCEQWWPAWEDLRLMFDKGSFKNLAEFDDAFRGTDLVSNWVVDLEMELINAAGRDEKWHERRNQFGEEFLRQFPNEDRFMREHRRRTLTETPVEAGGVSLQTDFDFGEKGIPLDPPPAAAEPASHGHEPLRGSAAPAVSQKIGRNDPCPCGSGKKYKKCCLSKDEAARQKTRASQVAASLQREEAAIETAPPALSPVLPVSPANWNEGAWEKDKLPPETLRRLDELWIPFEALSKPTAEQMDTLLSGLLELPAEATDWADLFHRFARAGHPELPAVFRRIAGNVAHTAEAGLAYFYWAAAEEMTHRGHRQLLPEVAAGFQKLDLESYDADALWQLKDWLLAAGFETETLALEEHFLPILRADDELMPYAAPDTCNLIFELRVGAHLRDDSTPEPDVNRLTAELRRNIEADIHLDSARNAAAVIAICSPETPGSRAEFELVMGDITEDTKAWEDCLRLFRALVQVAREAWRFEQRSPGCALRGLTLMLNSVYDAPRSGGKKPRNTSRNLLDHLLPAGLEARLVRSCRDMIGVNEPRARLMLEAHDVLLHFATRHQLLSVPEIARSRQALDRLKRQLNQGAPF